MAGKNPLFVSRSLSPVPATNAYGSARWMTPQEAQFLGLHQYYPDSIIIGQNTNGELQFFNQPGGIIVIAPARAGKGLSTVQANLIGYQGSIVCFDPKAENCAVAHLYRRNKLGHNVIVLDPTNKLKSYGLNPAVPTHRFNPLAQLSSLPHALLFDDVDLMVDALIVPSSSDKDAHWIDGGKRIIAGALTYLMVFTPAADHHLVMLSRLVSGLELPLDDLFTSLVHNGHPDPIIADVIAKKGAFWDKVPVKERGSFISMALRSLAWMNSPIWHDHLQCSDFHPYDLKAGKTTVFVVLPFDKMVDFAAWIRMVMTSCINAIIRAPNRSNIKTLFMLDEYAVLGKLAILEQSVPYIEGVGGRYFMVFQSLGQMSKLWPDKELHTMFANAGVSILFNTADEYTSEYASRFLGKSTTQVPGPNGMNVVARELLTPDEIRTMPSTDLIAFMRGQRPAWLTKLDVRYHPAFQGKLLPNPAYLIQSDTPKELISEAAPMLDAAQALARAKSGVSAASSLLTMPHIVAALEAKYPGKKIRLQDDMVGYDDIYKNPATGQMENIFVPLLHITLLQMLGKETA